MRQTLAQKRSRVYVVDASKLALAVGLGKRINTVMQTVFFMLADVLPVERALELVKAEIAKTYAHKGASYRFEDFHDCVVPSGT